MQIAFTVSTDITYRKEDEDQPSSKQRSPCTSITGELPYFSNGTRPDISYSVPELAKHCHAPTKRLNYLVKFVQRYISGTVELGLIYPRSSQTVSTRSIAVHIEVDLGGCKDTCRSTAGYVVTINGTPIAWWTRR